MHAVGRRVVDAPDERGHDVRGDLRGQDGLGRREHERHVDADAVLGEALARNDAGFGHRHLHHGVLAQRREVLPLLVHGPGLGLRGLERDVAVDELQDGPPRLLHVAVLAGEERRVRGDTLQDPPLVDFADLVDVGGVEEELHLTSPLQLGDLGGLGVPGVLGGWAGWRPCPACAPRSCRSGHDAEAQKRGGPEGPQMWWDYATLAAGAMVAAEWAGTRQY